MQFHLDTEPFYSILLTEHYYVPGTLSSSSLGAKRRKPCLNVKPDQEK